MDGDAEALAELLISHENIIWSRCRARLRDRSEFEDGWSLTALEATKSIRKLDDPAAFPGWLWRIADRAALQVADKRSDEKPVDPTKFLDEPQADPQHDLRGRRFDELIVDRDLVRGALQSLQERNPAFCEVLVLRYFGNLSYEQIAEKTGTPVGTVASRMQRAEAALKAIITREMEQ